ncbi:MAG: undecaprenyl-diphosphate phosphatase [Paludibacteraceae bacterium]|nr:undecaprenyl-diphosphate phosphatase [Paludibacteraceae bacterium]
MDWLDALLMGILQGLTEFLPVSSSGHLTIAQHLLHYSGEENLTFDIVVHAATVLSTLVVLWSEVVWILKGTFTTTQWNAEKTYAAKLIVSMIPIGIVGVFFKDKVEAIFGSGLLVVGVCLLVTAALLCFAQYARPRQKENISYLDSFIIGLGQALAVLPGLSRSGTTIATGLLLGNKREQVAQFSFLMVLVPIIGQAMLTLLDILKDGAAGGISVTALAVGFVAAFVSGCAACKFMINLVKRGNLIWFAIYCAIVGIVSIIIA